MIYRGLYSAETRAFVGTRRETSHMALRGFIREHREDRYRDQFVGILGHDLRNPLDAIAAGATLTITADSDQRSAKVASRILRSAHRMGA